MPVGRQGREPIGRSQVESAGFNRELALSYELRVKDFDLAMQDLYDFFFDVNSNLLGRGLKRLDDLLRPAAMSGFILENSVAAGKEGLEIKTTRKKGGAVDFHGARDQWLCVFMYKTDQTAEPARARRPMVFTEVYLGYVTVEDFRRNERGELGTRTATLDREGIRKFRRSGLYRLRS